jgi:signal transduction histidine kinase
VLDTGGGLPEEVARVVFEAFATTKADGLGVGMSIVRSIVEMHDGNLELSNDPGHGLAVRMRLPVWTNKEES